MQKFTLVGVDGNAFCVMGYTANALKQAKLKDKVDAMYKEATSGDYNNLICVCLKYVEMANEALGLEDEDEEEWEEE